MAGIAFLVFGTQAFAGGSMMGMCTGSVTGLFALRRTHRAIMWGSGAMIAGSGAWLVWEDKFGRKDGESDLRFVYPMIGLSLSIPFCVFHFGSNGVARLGVHSYRRWRQRIVDNATSKK